MYINKRNNEALVWPNSEFIITDILPSWENTNMRAISREYYDLNQKICFAGILTYFLAQQNMPQKIKNTCNSLVNTIALLNEKINLTKLRLPKVIKFQEELSSLSLYKYLQNNKDPHFQSLAEEKFLEVSSVMLQIEENWIQLVKLLAKQNITLDTPVLECSLNGQICNICLYHLRVNSLKAILPHSQITMEHEHIINIKKQIDNHNYIKIKAPQILDILPEIVEILKNIKDIQLANTYILLPPNFFYHLQLSSTFLYTSNPHDLREYKLGSELFLEIKNYVATSIINVSSIEDKRVELVNLALEKDNLEKQMSLYKIKSPTIISKI